MTDTKNSLNNGPGDPSDRTARRKRGFSLIETLAAIVVLAALVLGGSAVMSYAGRGVLIQGHRRVAAELANSVMEKETLADYLDITAPSTESYTQTVGGKTYDIRVRRALSGAGSTGDITQETKTIFVQVVYHDTEVISLRYARAFE